LDLLLEINNSPQIPPEKQVDVSLEPPSQADALVHPLDEEHELHKETPKKKLEDLVKSVPHSSYSSAKETLPQIVNDLKAVDGETYPADFLSADDIDNYIYEIDMALDPENMLPTLAPRAHPGNLHQSHPHLKNPTSVTNWLRKHAPKIFLQDGEAHGDADDAEGGHTGGRKTRGSRGERGGRASTRGKRVSAAARSAAAADRDVDASMDEDQELASTPAVRGKRKRNAEDDTGYKPRGSSTRPTKKKRKSEAAEGTPSARKSKKDKEAPLASAE
jgi:hypothetical protein